MSFNLSSKIIEQMSRIAQNYNIHKVVLFGSRARGDNILKSDIDIAIYPMHNFENKAHFIFELEDLETLNKIDIVFVNEDTESKLLSNIESDGVIIYERS